MSDSPAKSSSNGKVTKAYSCVRCFERKVKCDKEHPCSGCVRANVECIFRIPAPPRRKKKRTQEDILTERLNQYEQILQQKGFDVQKIATEPANSIADAGISRRVSTAVSDVSKPKPGSSGHPHDIPDSRSFVTANLIWEDGRSRYTENNLWTRVAEEFQTSQGALHESSSEDEETEEHEAEDNIDFALGLTPGSGSTRSLHPPPEHVSVLWQIYLDNINPFTMITHRPTLQPILQKAALNLDHLPRGLEALMFSIYSAAVLSMQDRDVENTFGESRAILLTRYRTATKAALSRAKFMGSSDIVVLQAFIIHMLTMRDVYDGRTLWTLSGVAIRIGEGMGMHRDGESLGLPPFKTEMRRRLWYQISTLEYRTAELSGSNKFRSYTQHQVGTKPPLNVNDDDLYPEMTELPAPRQKVTDMVLCCLRYEFSTFWSTKMKEHMIKESLFENYTTAKTMEIHDKAIDELEQILHEKYIQHCDQTVPIQLMASIVAKAGPYSMRFMVHHPRRWTSEAEIPASERKLLWQLCIGILETYILCTTSKSLQRFSWHSAFYFQWQALIYILDCLRADPLGAGAEEAWRLIDTTFECHPNLITDTKKAIHVAVGNLCLRTFNIKEQAFKREGRFLPAKTPEYITKLRQARDAALAKHEERKARALSRSQGMPSVSPNTTATNDLVNMLGYEISSSAALGMLQPQQHQSPSQPQQLQLQPQPQQQQPQQQHQQHQQHQQQPLPFFTIPPIDRPQKSATNQQPMPYWFESFSSVTPQIGGPGPTAVDLEYWMTMQDPVTADQTDQMDWNQWDYLLQDAGGIAGFGDSRTAM